jgi:hypothetical protein
VKTGARAPDAVATEFYGWYLDTLGADQDPLSDRYDTFSRYVAKELSARLVERLQGGRVPQRDYFTQSASYRPAWQRSVRAATVRQRAGRAPTSSSPSATATTTARARCWRCPWCWKAACGRSAGSRPSMRRKFP